MNEPTIQEPYMVSVYEPGDAGGRPHFFLRAEGSSAGTWLGRHTEARAEILRHSGLPHSLHEGCVCLGVQRIDATN